MPDYPIWFGSAWLGNPWQARQSGLVLLQFGMLDGTAGNRVPAVGSLQIGIEIMLSLDRAPTGMPQLFNLGGITVVDTAHLPHFLFVTKLLEEPFGVLAGSGSTLQEVIDTGVKGILTRCKCLGFSLGQ